MNTCFIVAGRRKLLDDRTLRSLRHPTANGISPLCRGDFLTLPSGAWGANCYLTDYKVIPYAGDASLVPLKVIAFGTSLTRGYGLKEESTYRYLVASYVEKNTERTISTRTFAHSAAYLTDASDAGTLALSAAPSKGDLNGTIPAVEPASGQADEGQADCALKRKDSLQNADLILLDGCINEVNAVLIVAPWTKPEDISKPIPKSIARICSRYLANS